MSQTITVRLDRSVASVGLADEAAVDSAAVPDRAGEAELLRLQRENLAHVCQALQAAINKVNEFKDDIFQQHKELVAKLSVEIARKVLLQKVQEGDYEIQSIIQEALRSAPTREDIVVHLNPEDLVECQRLQQDAPDGALGGIKLVADASIGRAECLVETPKGIVESLIQENLERISAALKKAE